LQELPHQVLPGIDGVNIPGINADEEIVNRIADVIHFEGRDKDLERKIKQYFVDQVYWGPTQAPGPFLMEDKFLMDVWNHPENATAERLERELALGMIVNGRILKWAVNEQRWDLAKVIIQNPEFRLDSWRPTSNTCMGGVEAKDANIRSFVQNNLAACLIKEGRSEETLLLMQNQDFDTNASEGSYSLFTLALERGLLDVSKALAARADFRPNAMLEYRGYVGDSGQLIHRKSSALAKALAFGDLELVQILTEKLLKTPGALEDIYWGLGYFYSYEVDFGQVLSEEETTLMYAKLENVVEIMKENARAVREFDYLMETAFAEGSKKFYARSDRADVWNYLATQIARLHFSRE
jgi:hypothetical protein